MPSKLRWIKRPVCNAGGGSDCVSKRAACSKPHTPWTAHTRHGLRLVERGAELYGCGTEAGSSGDSAGTRAHGSASVRGVALRASFGTLLSLHHHRDHQCGPQQDQRPHPPDTHQTHTGHRQQTQTANTQTGNTHIGHTHRTHTPAPAPFAILSPAAPTTRASPPGSASSCRRAVALAIQSSGNHTCLGDRLRSRREGGRNRRFHHNCAGWGAGGGQHLRAGNATRDVPFAQEGLSARRRRAPC